jgi:hypothetical protein
MTAEQVLNHLLPAIAKVKPNLTTKVEYNKVKSKVNSYNIPLPAIKEIKGYFVAEKVILNP